MIRLRVVLVAVLAILTLNACDDFFPSENSVASVTLSPTNIFMKTSETQQMTATQVTVGGTSTDVTSSATWTSSNTAVATVDSAGLVTAAGSGTGIATATITAQSGGQTASTSMTVATGKLTGITVGPVSPVLTVGTTLQMTALGNFDNSTTQTITNLVSWSTSDSTIATVSSSGLATGVRSGQVTFTATANTTGGTQVTGTRNVTIP